MIKEIGWYLENGRFSNLAEKLEASLKNYEEAKGKEQSEDVLDTLREEARLLFEEHCVRSGMREKETPFINIDAEFFNGNTLDEAAMNSFIKNIIKGHCFQKVLWTYMGTTGSFTAISRAEMANAGLKYDDYLPLEYKGKSNAKKPLKELTEQDTELFYMYGDGTVSKEYVAEKAKLNFNTLEDKSGINWKAGYDPNGSVKKDGWHGEYDYNESWVRVDEKITENRDRDLPGAVTIELIRNGDSAILYDPGMLLLSPPVMMYLTGDGEQYGNLSMDKAGTVERIKETLKKMGIEKISAISGIAPDKPELLAAYKALLGETAQNELYIADIKIVYEVKEGHIKTVAQTAAEGYGTALERKLRAAGKHTADVTSVLSVIATGRVTVPLSPRKTNDGLLLGLGEDEVKEINSVHINTEYESAYNTVLSNLFASWALYEGSGLSKAEIAAMTSEYLEHCELRENDEPRVITAQTSLGEIINGSKQIKKDGVRTIVSGIPGVFSEPETVDFFDEKAKEKYLKNLEKKQILPKGGAVSALSALETLHAAGSGKKEELNRRLTRAFGEYKAIAMSTGMPFLELVEAVKASVGLGTSPLGENTNSEAALNRKIYYELSAENLIEEAKKENLQTKEVSLESEASGFGESVVIGGVQGPALDEVLFTREKLLESGFTSEEAEKAVPFLHGVRFASSNPIIPLPLAEALNSGSIKTAGELRQSVLGALEADSSVSYNLSTEEGLKAYFESGRAIAGKVSKKDIQELLRESVQPRYTQVPSSLAVSNVEPRYRAMGNIVPLKRGAPKGMPEKIRTVNVSGDTFFNKVGTVLDTLSNSSTAEFTVPLEFKNMHSVGNYSSDSVSSALDLRMNESSGAADTGRALHFSGRQARDGIASSSPGVAGKAVSNKNKSMHAVGNNSSDSVTSALDLGNNVSSEAADTERVLQFPERSARDTELERLRKIEANYEKDKTNLVREKQPALARSESHDVGHAEGERDDVLANPRHVGKEMINEFMEEAKRSF